METNWFHYISYINFPTSYRNRVLSIMQSVHKRGKWGSVKLSQKATRTTQYKKELVASRSEEGPRQNRT